MMTPMHQFPYIRSEDMRSEVLHLKTIIENIEEERDYICELPDEETSDEMMERLKVLCEQVNAVENLIKLLDDAADEAEYLEITGFSL